MTPLIQVKNIEKSYLNGDLSSTVLSNVSFDIEKGEFVAIMGPSGSGKSTLMHIIGALDTASSGSYKLNGVEISSLSDDQLAEIRNNQIGFIFQAFNLLPRTTALENVMLPMKYARIEKAKREQIAKKYLKLVGLEQRMNHMPNQLSGGQQQRVAIARGLSLSPSLLLADEPTGNIASAQAEEVMQIFSKLNDQGHTIVMITHEPDIARYAQRVIYIKDGRVLKDSKKKGQKNGHK
jgi:putative ABC transport system ATP-binding protein